MNSSSIISEDDIILPDDALVRKILSKDATVEKNLVAGLANLTRSGVFKEMIISYLINSAVKYIGNKDPLIKSLLPTDTECTATGK